MRHCLALKVALAGSLLAAGCSSMEAKVSFSPDDLGVSNATYAILLFTDGNSEHVGDFPRAAAVVTSAFEDAFLQGGLRLVSPGNEDFTVTGLVSAFYKGSFFGPYTTVGFHVKAVDRRTGAVFWTASHAKKTEWDYDYDPVLLVQEAAQETVDRIVASGKLR